MLIVENIGIYKGCAANELALFFGLGFIAGFIAGLLLFQLGIGLLIGLIIAMLATFISANILQAFKRNKPNHFFAKKRQAFLHKMPSQYSTITSK